jgi:hypothetical protein
MIYPNIAAPKEEMRTAPAAMSFATRAFSEYSGDRMSTTTSTALFSISAVMTSITARDIKTNSVRVTPRI